MRAVVLEEPGRLRLHDVPPPQPGLGEALVRARRVGICGTDLHAYAGNQNFFSYPRIMGHELAVEVLALGAGVEGVSVGETCCVIPYLHCGRCIACRRGKTNCCIRMQVLGVHIDGGMREQFTLPADKLLKADGAAPEQLALVEMLAIGAHAVRRAAITQGAKTLVIGAGPIGLATAQFALLAGADVAVMEMDAGRLDFCRRALGIERLVDARNDAQAQLQSLHAGELPTLVFDCTGSARSMTAAFDYVAHGGTLTLVGHVRGDLTFSDPHFHSREMSLLASRNATSADFSWVIKRLRTGQIQLAEWVTHRATPQSILRDFPTWLDPAAGVIKAMLSFD
ncbi:MAG: zinc-binding alcohol dehydrogenase family protein [Chloroflexi bacterium]|nr:zinc-binding alcohol dehydrogenase family protein [Chloroflexota bacterium]MCY4246891.1 zinc-binding alcohol dehydrogenase family protein [Chloroflexota bacterium]